MSERTDACDRLGQLLAELQTLRQAWQASSDTLLRLGAERLDAPLDALAEIDRRLRQGTRVLGAD